MKENENRNTNEDMEEKIYYMAYGSNLNLDQMARLAKDAEKIGVTVLHDYHLMFRGEEGRKFLNIESRKGSNVPVLIWKVNHEDEKSLDEFEEYPIIYHKEYLELDLDGHTYKAMAYVMNDGFTTGSPSDTYYNTVVEGYKTANFDINILEEALMASVTN